MNFKSVSFDPESNNFDNFENDVEKSVMLYHANSGHGKFLGYNKLFHNDGQLNRDVCQRAIADVNKEVLTEDEQERLLSTYAENVGRSSSNIDLSTNPKSTLQGLPSTLDPC